MNEPVLYFIVSFLIGVAWFRLLFLVAPKYFNAPLTRTVSKLNWHHLHWGVVFVFVAFLEMFWARTLTLVGIVLAGLGFGMIMDLFIPSLKMHSNREQELALYKSTYKSTIILMLSIVVLVVLLLWSF